MGYETYEDQLEDEQDSLGLYQSELTKQIHLRNKQRKEWDAMKKKMAISEEERISKKSKEQQLIEQEEKAEEKNEIEETRVSKRLTSAMTKSALAETSETLKKVVDVLHNQNGNFF